MANVLNLKEVAEKKIHMREGVIEVYIRFQKRGEKDPKRRYYTENALEDAKDKFPNANIIRPKYYKTLSNYGDTLEGVWLFEIKKERKKKEVRKVRAEKTIQTKNTEEV